MCKEVCNAQKEDKHLKEWTGYTAKWGLEILSRLIPALDN